jgi:hypothetical protein
MNELTTSEHADRTDSRREIAVPAITTPELLPKKK